MSRSSNLQVMDNKRRSGDAGMVLTERKKWGETPKGRVKYNPSMPVMTKKEKRERDKGWRKKRKLKARMQALLTKLDQTGKKAGRGREAPTNLLW